MKNIRYFLEAVFLKAIFFIFGVLPVRGASATGAFIGRITGPRLAASRKAHRNLERAFPHISLDERNTIITGMWKNLGRVIAEYPHLERLGQSHTSIEGAENLTKALNRGKGAICFGAHLGNWEVNSVACLLQLGITVDASYRAPNNRWSADILMRARSLGGRLKAHPKSRSGGKRMMECVKNGGILGILIDQKYNEGLSVPFFGHDAMTNPFFVQLAQKYECPLIPVRNVRTQGIQSRLIIYDEIKTFENDGTPRPVRDVILDAHNLLEGWIKETPAQWLWLHRRWKEQEQ
ncbi:MAG: lipid A biosynthesis acyltransferase [Alphaproteobacteria bacterium]|nr:lipid A biosynthesis acyltransferase [Alphaproteobacteria bacterium]